MVGLTDHQDKIINNKEYSCPSFLRCFVLNFGESHFGAIVLKMQIEPAFHLGRLIPLK
jgi:hypothetical protein